MNTPARLTPALTALVLGAFLAIGASPASAAAPTKPTLKVSRASVTEGARVTLAGRVPHGKRTVVLQAKGSSWHTVARAKSSRGGWFTFKVSPTSTTSYRVKATKRKKAKAVTSSSRRVTVVPRAAPTAPRSTPKPTPAPSPSETTPEPPVPDLVKVSILSDSHAYNTGSWFRLTVVAGKVPDAKLGTFAGFPGGSTSTLRTHLDEVAGDEVVILQAGTNDLHSARTPTETAAAIEDLVTDLQATGSDVILASIPPSSLRPAQILATNLLITAWAAQTDVPLLDVTTDVSTLTGDWREGETSDGIHANQHGSQVMADAALEQLPGFLTAE